MDDIWLCFCGKWFSKDSDLTYHKFHCNKKARKVKVDSDD